MIRVIGIPTEDWLLVFVGQIPEGSTVLVTQSIDDAFAFFTQHPNTWIQA